MTARRFVSVGECMIEMSGGAGNHWEMGVAGDTLNTAYHFRKATAVSEWRVSYVTALGDDRYSDQIAAFITDAGIETDHVQRIAGKRPGLYLINQENGDRVFTYWRENSAARNMADDVGLLASAFQGGDVVYLSGITLAILSPDRRAALIDLLAGLAKDTQIAFDPNIRPLLWESRDGCRDAINSVAALSRFVFPSFDDEVALFGDASQHDTLRRYVDLGAGEVILKDGARPCWFADGTQFDRSEAPAKVGVVDATGAGDAFNAGFLAARLSSRSIDQAVLAGQSRAADVIQRHGAL